MDSNLIEIAAGGKTIKGYLALPPQVRGKPVLVLQEWWGLVDHIKDVCRRFAEAGFLALAPDLYQGACASGPDEAGRLMMALNIEETKKDVLSALRYLLRHPACEGKEAGVIGFCMGGQLALLAGCESPDVAAVADFYGIHPNVKLDFSKLQAQVLGIFAEKDAFVTPKAARQLETDIRGAGKKCEFHIFPGAHHAFFNDTRPAVYNKKAALEAWTKTLNFFNSYLN